MYWVLVERSEPRVADAGFWFEDVNFASPRLGAPVTSAEIETIARVARSELAKAFQGLPMTLSDRRDATYRVGVVQGFAINAFGGISKSRVNPGPSPALAVREL